jgi:hypothetical protein
MNKFKKLYRDFFGLTEQAVKGTPDPAKDVVLSPEDAKVPEKIKAAQDILKTTKGRLHIEGELDVVGHEDDDIDNDGKSNTKSDKYLKNRRDARKQAIKEEDMDEARLVNNITDYRGGVEYVLRNPEEAESVAAEIQQWAEKKGFTVVTKKISQSGKVGYFYFRLGQDPALESQKIQGYVAQKPEIKHFRFNVRGEQTPKPQMRKPAVKRNPNINI